MAEHAGHSHALRADADARRLWIALGLIASFMAVEVVVGILANSLALLSDAAHMLTDAGALVVSLIVLRLVKRPAAGNPARQAPQNAHRVVVQRRRDDLVAQVGDLLDVLRLSAVAQQRE